jgi:hypothetical protein
MTSKDKSASGRLKWPENDPQSLKREKKKKTDEKTNQLQRNLRTTSKKWDPSAVDGPKQN